MEKIFSELITQMADSVRSLRGEEAVSRFKIKHAIIITPMNIT